MGVENISSYATLAALAEVLTVHFPAATKKAYTGYQPSFMSRFPLDTDSIGDDGRRYDFETGPGHNTVASGRLSTSSEYEDAKSQTQYDSIWVKPVHINSLQTALSVNYADLEFARDEVARHDLGFNKATAAYEDQARTRDIGYWSDRNFRVGTVQRAVSGYTTDDTDADHLT